MKRKCERCGGKIERVNAYYGICDSCGQEYWFTESDYSDS